MIEKVFQLIKGTCIMGVGEDSFKNNFGVSGGFGLEIFATSVQRWCCEEQLSLS